MKFSITVNVTESAKKLLMENFIFCIVEMLQSTFYAEPYLSLFKTN